MNGKEYGELAQVTESKDFSPMKSRVNDKMVRLLHAALGLSSELSEIQAAITDAQNSVDVFDYVNLAEEAGDLAWYTAIALSAMELDPMEFWPANYPNSDKATIDEISGAVDLLVIEVGEFNNQLKRAIFYGKGPDQEATEKALRGICQTVRILACDAGTDLSTVMERNIAKLTARYGEKFSEYAALNRDLKTERDVLEGK
jgi:NTP pyrophosphatase (non-canonical NTP hydrolase)